MNLTKRLKKVSFEFSDQDIKDIKSAFIALKKDGVKTYSLKELSRAIREEKGLKLAGVETTRFTNALASALEKIQGVKVLKPAPDESKTYSLRVVDFSGIKA